MKLQKFVSFIVLDVAGIHAEIGKKTSQER